MYSYQRVHFAWAGNSMHSGVAIIVRKSSLTFKTLTSAEDFAQPEPLFATHAFAGYGSSSILI